MNPNDIVGQPKERWIWLAPDWSDFKPETAKQPSGYTRVKVRDVTFADGRIVTMVLDANGQPVAADGTPTTPTQARVLDQITDEEQTKRFKEAQAAAAAAGKNKVRSYPGTDPVTGLPAIVTEYEDGSKDYDSSKPATTGTTTKPAIPPGGSSSTEGTPLPGGGWDNNRPRQVIKDKNGTVVWSEELTGADLTAWRNNQTASQKPPEPPDRVGKPTGNTRTKSENGRAVKEVEYILPDGTKEWRSQTEQSEPDRVGKPTGNTRTTTRDGQTVKETEYVLADGSKEWRAQSAPADNKGLPKVPAQLRGWRPDPNKPGYGLFERREQVIDAVNRGVENGGISPEDGAKLLEIDADSARAMETQIHNERTSGLTARSQDLTRNANAANAGLTGTNNAVKQWQEITAGATPGSGSIRDSLPGLLELNRMGARSYGGDAPVTPYGPLSAAMAPGAPPNAVPPPGALALPPPGAPTLSSAMGGPDREAYQAYQAAQAAKPPLVNPPTFVDPATGGFGIPGGGPVSPTGTVPGSAYDATPAGGNVQMAPQPGYDPALLNRAQQIVGPGTPQRYPHPEMNQSAQPGLSAQINYDPSRVNQLLLAAGLDPDILSQFG